MADSLAYKLVLDNAQYVGGMRAATAELKGLEAESRRAEGSGFGGQLDSIAGRTGSVASGLKKVTAEIRELNTTSLDNGLGPLSADLQEAIGPASRFTAEAVTLRTAISGLGAELTGSAGLAVFTGAAATATAVVTGLATAVAVSQAALSLSGTDEARVSLEKFQATAQGLGADFKDVAGQFAELVGEMSEPITLTINNEATGVIAAIRRDFNSLRNATGFGRKSYDATPESLARIAAGGSDKAKQLAIQREADAQSIREQNAAEQTKNQRAEEYMDAKAARDRAAGISAEAVERASQARISAAREAYYAATLTKEQNLQRQLAELKASGPTDPAAIARQPAGPTRDATAERIARHASLERELADLQDAAAAKRAAAAEKAEREADAARRKAESEEKAAAARERASATFAADDAILQARAAGNEKLTEQLERQQAVEETKQRLIRDQGLAPTQAAAAAERHQKLLEAATRREENPRRSFTLTREQSEARRAEREAALRKARDDRFNQLGAAVGAAGLAIAQPAAEKKDHVPQVVKKLDKLDAILTRLDDIAST